MPSKTKTLMRYLEGRAEEFAYKAPLLVAAVNILGRKKELLEKIVSEAKAGTFARDSPAGKDLAYNIISEISGSNKGYRVNRFMMRAFHGYLCDIFGTKEFARTA